MAIHDSILHSFPIVDVGTPRPGKSPLGEVAYLGLVFAFLCGAAYAGMRNENASAFEVLGTGSLGLLGMSALLLWARDS